MPCDDDVHDARRRARHALASVRSESLRYARAALGGPLALETPAARAVAVIVVVLLTLLTEIGGVVAWPFIGVAAAMRGARRWLALLAGSASYACLAVFVVPIVASWFGRIPLPCAPEGSLAPRSFVYCVALRNYVVPALAADALAIADDVRARDPGTSVRYLDGAFPFPGLPLLPHLSHGDAHRLDLALPFESGGSPIGYFGYAPLADGESPACPPRLFDLRWDLDPIQPLLGPPVLDVARASRLVRAAVARPGIRRVLVEPHVADQLGVRSSEIAFQGCHAARHDDHVHLDAR